MIYGTGLIGSAFRKIEAPDRCSFFCRGVSNSLCSDTTEYFREIQCLNDALLNTQNTLYYFSSVAVKTGATDKLYYHHKLYIERMLLNSGKARIVRLPQVVGDGGNSQNFLNFILHCVTTRTKFRLNQNAKRNFVKVEDLVSVLLCLHHKDRFWLNSGNIIEISSPFDFTATEVVRRLEEKVGYAARYELFSSDEELLYDPSVFNKCISTYRDVNPRSYFDDILSGILSSP